MIGLLLLITNIAILGATEIVIDNFKSNVYVDGKYARPAGWTKGHESDGKFDYFIFKEGDKLFLRSGYIPDTTGRIIYIEKRTKLSAAPFLSWKWRARKFPALVTKGTSEEVDNVATVYTMFRKNLRSYLIKYQWSQINCKNSKNNEPFYFKSKSSSRIVIRPLRCTAAGNACCGDKADVWVTEKVNLLEDYMKFFGKDKDSVPENLEGVGVLSDGDDTNTPGVSADFSDFVLTSE
jgi:hypothetical protein